MDVGLKQLTRDLVNIVGQDNAFSDRPTALAYAKDTMPWDVEPHHMPYAVVRPADSREVSAILTYASAKKIPVHTHGSGTSLVGLGRPKTNAIVLDTARMQDLKIFPERGYFEVGPGMHIGNLRKALAPHNALLPIFPGSEPIATIGGSVSVNTSAHAVDASLCKPGDYVLGMEVVLATGEILQTGTQSTRKPAGIEATKFLVGSEGLLCVITRIRMRLIPKPHMANIVAYFNSTEEILDTVMAMYREGMHTPLFFEYLDEKSSKVGFEAVGLEAPPGAVAMMSMHSATEVGCREKARIFLEFVKKANPIEARIVSDAAEWDKIWSSRAEAGNYVYRLGSTFGSEITPRVDKLKLAFREAKELILNLDSFKGNEFYSFGHIGAPTIHGYAFIPTKDISNEVKKAVTLEVREKTEALNVKYGGCGGEWGLTAQRAGFLEKKYGPVYTQTLIRLKKTFDPENILNRGNLEGWL
ncbi:FAD-binding protein [Desulfosarcina alkanivorans]|uniref:D-lactate dehydrogenase (cytochrome) n=1 Tax=Desulfosarcina alkanivorans TaxID=571177 RepID=A0A5K7YQ87_9BACT|nr:FAD-binding oxidoreductase [Desulfosarcina alkanivorans]BBO68474.1 FAD-binding protein [Desulfosarcina alkanivorans]